MEECRANYYSVKKHAFRNDPKVIAIFESIDHWNLKQCVNKFNVTINGSRRTSTIDLGQVDPDVSSLRSIAREQLSIPIADFEFRTKTKVNAVIKVQQDSDFTGLTSPLELTVHIQQIGFSNVPNLKAALDMCGEGTKHKSQMDLADFMSKTKANTVVGMDKYTEELAHACSTIDKLRTVLSVDTGDETTKCTYILPVIVAAVLISGDVMIEEERKIEAPFAHGPVDYAFLYEDTIICVTEAKDGDMKHGLRQNIAQLAATRNERKRKIDKTHKADDITYYGIATTYNEWQLIELEGNEVRSSVLFGPGPNSRRNDVAEVIQHLVNVLEKSKTH